MRRAVALVLLAGCASRVTVWQVRASFREEWKEVIVPVPGGPAESPSMARNAEPVMSRTIELGERRLREFPEPSLENRYVSTLLACAHMMRDDYGRAETILSPYRVKAVESFSRTVALCEAAQYALTGCQAVKGRAEFETMLTNDGKGIENFLRDYGGYAGYMLPDPAAPNYAADWHRLLERLRRDTIPEIAGDPFELERTTAGRRVIRRLLAEQAHTDAGAILWRMPEPGSEDGADVWLVAVGAGLWINYSFSLRDIVPPHLSAAQKEWHQEIARSGFDEAIKSAGRRLPKGKVDTGAARSYRELYQALKAARERSLVRMEQ